MLKILDKYILKRYLVTFITMILMFIPIGIVIDVSEKVNKMIENKVAFSAVAMYYLNFTIFFANLLFPIFLFLSIIWFTSKLANNTEIITILSSGISFKRFLKPYIIGASIISVFALLMGFFIVPKASEGYWNFRYNYLIGGGKDEMQDKSDIYRQISKDEYIYVSSFNPDSQMAFNFSMEKFEGDQLKYKVTANRIQYNPKDSTYTLYGFKKRKIGVLDDQIVSLPKKDTVLNIDIEDLTPVVYIAETLALYELNSFIKKEQLRGSSNLDVYKVVLYKKFSIPVSGLPLSLCPTVLHRVCRLV